MESTNITVKIDADLAKEARVVAARKGTSISRMVAEQLECIVKADQAYAAAKGSALRKLKRGYDLEWEKPVSRDKLHERESLR